jgi:hypothetical protein
VASCGQATTIPSSNNCRATNGTAPR